MRRHSIFIGLFLTVSLLLCGGAAQAQEAALKGHVNSMAILPMDKTQSIRVKLYDDSETSLALKAAFERALMDAGYTLSEDAALALSFEFKNSVESSSVDDPGRLEIVGRSGGYEQSEEYSARFEVFSSQQEQRGIATTAGSLRMDAAVTDRSAGRRVWQGWINADSTGQSERDVAAQLIPPLVDSLGKTVRNAPLSEVD